MGRASCYESHKESKAKLTAAQREELLSTLRVRFEENMKRHKGLAWDKVEAKLEANADKLWSLAEMERTGGESDVVGYDRKKNEFIFFTTAPQRVRRAAAASATTAKDSIREKNTIRRTPPSTWLPKSALNFYRKNSTANCRLSAPSTQKHRAG